MAVRVAVAAALLAAPLRADVIPGAYQLQNAETGAFLSIEVGNRNNGALVLTTPSEATGMGHWNIDEFQRTTAYVLQHEVVGKYLNAAGAAAKSSLGTYLHLWDNPGDPNSQFFIHMVENGDGDTVVLQNVASQAFVNVAPGNDSVRLWNEPGSRRSQWVMKGISCRDIMPGEMCYHDILWAKEYGISTRPEWYPGLTNASSFADFQSYLHHCYWGRCPMPCARTAYHECGMPGRCVDHDCCSDEVDADSTCGRAISWAMNHGITQHPDWYPTLNENSNAMQFQARLYHGQQLGVEPDHRCPQPCCHDTFPGEECHEHVTWAMLYGINKPELEYVYPDILRNETTSNFAEFQAYMHLCYEDRCPEPCATTITMAFMNSTEVICPFLEASAR